MGSSPISNSLGKRWTHISFFFNDTATTEIYTLALHDALPILPRPGGNLARGPNVLRLISIGLLVASLALVIIELIAYSRDRARMPESLSVAGGDVGGLDQTEAIERLLQVYSAPIEVVYRDQVIQISPAAAGFRLDTEALMGAAELERTGTDFWSGFWDFLWNRPSDPA